MSGRSAAVDPASRTRRSRFDRRREHLGVGRTSPVRDRPRWSAFREAPGGPPGPPCYQRNNGSGTVLKNLVHPRVEAAPVADLAVSPLIGREAIILWAV